MDQRTRFMYHRGVSCSVITTGCRSYATIQMEYLVPIYLPAIPFLLHIVPIAPSPRQHAIIASIISLER